MNTRKQIYCSKISIRKTIPCGILKTKLFLIKHENSLKSIEFHIILGDNMLNITLVNGEIELFHDFLLSNESYFEYRNTDKNRLICAEILKSENGTFSLFIGEHKNKTVDLEILELVSKKEFESLKAKLKWLINKIKVLRDEFDIVMYDKNSSVYINSNGSLLDLEEIKADRFYYEDIKLRKVGKYYQISC